MSGSIRPLHEAENEQQKEIMEEIESEFTQEPIDRAWSFDTYSDLQEASNTDETLNTALLSIEC